ncbi:MAG: hypothetical protein WAU70_08765 [Flavobacteriales bacterium]
MTTFLAAALFIGQFSVSAQIDKHYTEGSVFELSMIRTEANSQDEYLERLNNFYIPVMRKAQEQGLILSFRVLAGSSANDDDFDVMLLVETASMAMMDPDAARDAKWDAIEKEVTTSMGGDEKRKSFTAGLNEVRDYKGNKLMRDMRPK